MKNGNEILLNLDNHQNLSNSELIGGMIELASRAKSLDVDWNEHEITSKCFADLKDRQPRMNSKHVAQLQLIMDGLKCRDQQMWQDNATHVLRMLHKFKARDMA